MCSAATDPAKLQRRAACAQSCPSASATEIGDSVFLNPDHLTAEQMRLVDAWLVANGCRHHVAREPIRILGDRVYYTALSLRNDASLAARPVRDLTNNPIELAP